MELQSKFKKLESLFAWAAFYSNGKSLAVPTNRDEVKFAKVQKEIKDLKKQIID